MLTPETLARIAALNPEQRAALDARVRQLGLSHLLEELPGSRISDSSKTEGTGGSPHVGPALSVFFFSDNGSQVGTGKYDLLMRAAAFADRNDFSAVWVPERHFHPFGGLYPNPAILGAALAMTTKRIAIRAGSVVLPLHHPARVAEEWAVVDNLSGGRIGVAFASGWRQDDFILATTGFRERKTITSQAISTVRALWRGDQVQFATANGETCNIRVFPRPIQPELPAWLAVAGNPDTWRLAGRIGLNVLTMLGTQSIAALARKIDAYTESLAAHGHNRSHCRVTIVLHTLVGDDEKKVHRCVDAPMKRYLSNFLSQSDQTDSDCAASGHGVTGSDVLCSAAFDWYFDRAGLFGTPDRCKRLVQELASIGVDEIACLLDFGADPSDVIAALPFLNELREQIRCVPAPPEAT
jgi:natural product biosynthesis luciferase-like monooxygenase protein